MVSKDAKIKNGHSVVLKERLCAMFYDEKRHCLSWVYMIISTLSRCTWQ